MRIGPNPPPIRYLRIDGFQIRHQFIATKIRSDPIRGGVDWIGLIRSIRPCTLYGKIKRKKPMNSEATELKGHKLRAICLSYPLLFISLHIDTYIFFLILYIFIYI